ncbi:hypothetical protein PsorP6_007987 [Peronosclerospora sorghi]|uniref:Uncharacterized protein n=1 Tax=Peronosclerospora sorghi TaxID=230839 RepID=A0ACC0WAN4_9STRA|nr:hypothetical protein PsorP6_007987 [Peronosclerospora sorghi]
MRRCVGHGRGATNHLRIRARERTEPKQSTKDTGDVGPKHAAIHVRFINDKESIEQSLSVRDWIVVVVVLGEKGVGQHVMPLSMVRQNTHVQHIWICEEDPRVWKDVRSRLHGRIAILSRRTRFRVEKKRVRTKKQKTNPYVQKWLQADETTGTSLRLHHVVALENRLDGYELVRIQVRNVVAVRERVTHAQRNVETRELTSVTWTGWTSLHMHKCVRV